MVENVSKVLATMLPNFWKIARGYMEGKFKKVFYGVRIGNGTPL